MAPLPLEADIRARIARSGSITVRQYMGLCLSHPEHGYYMTRDPLGRTGDFITAPEISQMFGELLGVWAASVWQAMGAPDNVRLVELGPGRGTLMFDALRAANVVPAFRAALVVHMVELSPVLQSRQQETLQGVDVPVMWHASFDDIPPGPVIILANEFFDALPVHQAIKQINGWYERVVEIDGHGDLAFGIAREPIPLFEQLLPRQLRDAPLGSVFEWRPDNFAADISRRVMREGGAGLVIDYGHVESAAGETLQAVQGHAFADPLRYPGAVDLTAHVDFQALATALGSMGARVDGPITQADLLHRLGIDRRAAALRHTADAAKAEAVDAALARLTSPARTGMGQMFKAIAFGDPKLGPFPGFG